MVIAFYAAEYTSWGQDHSVALLVALFLTYFVLILIGSGYIYVIGERLEGVLSRLHLRSKEPR